MISFFLLHNFLFFPVVRITAAFDTDDADADDDDADDDNDDHPKKTTTQEHLLYNAIILKLYVNTTCNKIALRRSSITGEHTIQQYLACM